MSFLSDRALDRIQTYSRRHPGTIGDPNPYPHMIPPRTVFEVPTPPAVILISHGSHVEPAPRREDIGSHPGSEVVPHI